MASNTVVSTNIMALNAHRNLSAVGKKQATSSNRLASGKKINSAADDAAGLAISEKMRAQINGLDMAAKNGEDAISLAQTAEGSLSEVSSMLQRMRELTVQASNDTNTTADRAKISDEVTQLQEEISAISQRTEFNTKVLTSGAYTASVGGGTGEKGSLVFQIGANVGQSISLNIAKMSATGLGVQGIASSIGAANATSAGISSLLATIDSAIETVAVQRSNLGAKQNRLEHTISNLQVSSENLSSAKSRIEDTDMAKEMMNLTSSNVLQQAATTILAQANQAPNSIVQLLG